MHFEKYIRLTFCVGVNKNWKIMNHSVENLKLRTPYDITKLIG